jgi:predicted DNA-binding transcriptional regulator
MSKDQVLGVLILICAIAVIIVYGWLLYVPAFRLAALVIVDTVAVVGVMGIIAWIGWTMATTPAPEPIESFEEPAMPESTSGKEESEE